MALNEDELEQLMERAGIREGARKKLRSANQAPTEATPSDDTPPSRPRGHGPASQTRPVIDDL